MTTMKKTPEWNLGRFGERRVRQWFQDQGWFVVPTYAIEDGGAPKLVGLLKGWVLPDMQVTGTGQLRWVEVKTKTRATLYQKTHRWQHGIDLRNWLDYLAVEHETGLPGHLAILQLEPEPMLLLAPFVDLQYGARIYEGEGDAWEGAHGVVRRGSFRAILYRLRWRASSIGTAEYSPLGTRTNSS